MSDICPECGGQIDRKVRPRSETCSDTCKKARWARLRNPNQDLERAVAEIDPSEVAREVVADELRPYARDAVTQKVQEGLADLVKLTPELVASLGRDLESEDPNARGNAQRLVAKFTFGAVTEDEAKRQQTMHVHLPGMPSPAQHGDAVIEGTVERDTEDTRICERCGDQKGLGEFEPGATRCDECQQTIKREVVERYG